MKQIVVGLVAIAATALAGCGGGDSDGGSADGFSGDYPQCSDIWKVGETIDLSSYEGCEDGDTIEAAVVIECFDEARETRGTYTSYEDRLWVVQEGAEIDGEAGAPGKVTDTNPNC